MAYDERLAQRMRKLLAKQPGVTERRMFGGLALMVRGNMCCGILKDELMVRVGPEQYEEALAQSGTRPMDFTGRPMKGMIFVDPNGCKTEKALAKWIERGLAFAGSLPAK